MDKLGLKWDRLAGVTTDDCPNLTWKNVGLLKRMQDKGPDNFVGHSTFITPYSNQGLYPNPAVTGVQLVRGWGS